MGRSRGTRETQGVNGDAAVLQRKMDAALSAMSTGAILEPCEYAHHRGRDWRLTPEHPVRCGVCHPPARGLEVVRCAD